MSFKEFYVTCNPPLLLDGVDEVVSHVQGCFQEVWNPYLVSIESDVANPSFRASF